MFQLEHQNSYILDELKNNNASPIHKKRNCHDKSSYRPITFLPLLSKPFCSLHQDRLPKYQGGFRKNI